MSQLLRQSTQVVVRIGPAVAVGDGFTPVTNLTLSGADEAELLKAAGAGTVSIAAATFAAITGADGYYDLTLTTSHTDTVGTLDVAINDDSLILPIWKSFMVMEEAAYDALFSTGNMPADAKAISGSTTAADNFERGAVALVLGACEAGSTTTNIVTNLAETTNDHYNGRVITFTSGALAGQTRNITDYVGSTGALTVVALTEAPADTDQFVIS